MPAGGPTAASAAESFYGRRTGAAGVEMFRKALAETKDVEAAIAEVNARISYEKQQQLKAVTEIVAKGISDLGVLQQILEKTQELASAHMDRTRERLDQFRMETAGTPEEKQRLLSEQIERIREKIAQSLKEEPKSARDIEERYKTQLDLAKELLSKRMEQGKVELDLAQKAREYNQSLAERLALARPEERVHARLVSERLRGVGSTEDLQKLLGSETARETIQKFDLLKLLPQSLLQQYAQATAPGAMQTQVDASTKERLLADWSGEQQQVVKQFQDAAEAAGVQVRDGIVKGIAEALSDKKLDIGIAVKAELQTLLKIDPSSATVQQIAEAIANILANLPAQTARETERALAERAARSAQAERAELATP